MKKVILIAGLAAAAFTLSNCSSSEAPEAPEAKTVSLIVSTEVSKTVNDGLDTKWEKGDALTVFIAPSGTTGYSDNLKFSVKDVENGVFEAETELEGDSNDWFLFYPYSQYFDSPANADEARTYIGCRSDATQKQEEYGSKAHLAGGSSKACFPLYGIASDVAADETPVVQMHQIASVVAVKVTNATDAAVMITSASLTAEEDIVGYYIISFDKQPVSIKPYDYVSKTATVEVNNAAELASGESAVLYVGIKPFTAKAGSSLELKVKGSNGEVVASREMKTDLVFEAGHIKTLSINYDAKPVVSDTEWIRKDLGNVADGTRVVIVSSKDGSNYAMANNLGTSGAPSAKPVQVKDSRLVIAPEESIQWDLVYSATSGEYSFNMPDDDSKWLYATDTNNGLRVGVGAAKVFTVKDQYFVNVATSRYVGVYNAADWRCYTSINNNIKDQSFAFYVEVEKGSETPDETKEAVATPVFSPAGGSVDAGTTVSISCETEGAEIYYTTDGSNPTTQSTKGTSVTVNEAVTIKAVAVKEGYYDSSVAVAVFTIKGGDYQEIEGVTASTAYNTGTVNGNPAFKIGSTKNNGVLTIPAGYSEVKFFAAGWKGSTSNSFTIANGTIDNATQVTVVNDDNVAGITANDFSVTGVSGKEYVLKVSDSSKAVTLTGKRFVAWGFVGK